MNNKGTMALETALVLPLVIVLLVVLILALAKSLSTTEPEKIALVKTVRVVDKVKRGLSLIGDVLE